MTQITVNATEIPQFLLQTFGNKKVTAITAGEVVLLVADIQHSSDEQRKNNHSIAIDKLCGMFKNTSLLSSDDFAKNKRIEKALEEKKYIHE